jgi:GT2 family glycosyltransferase/2-polyprenyl-3-methyl-5-hydroxy-6-metoxy-1,4-benzoquinol methylase
LTQFRPTDLTVVIPTRGRPDILARTLERLRAQTAPGFEIIVVVDGTDQGEILAPGARLVVTDHRGPGQARNEGARVATTSLVLFLGDDMQPAPGLVATHLQGHGAEPADEVGVLGRMVWHPEVADGRLNQWLDWSGTQFEVSGLVPHEDAHWARFYSCNVSLKREWFLAAGGFDPDFAFFYEDLDCGWRLGEHGLRLRYEPEALVEHLHRYDWDAVVRRFDGIAVGEALMARKHPDFDPWFRRRVEDAMSVPTPAAVWSRVVDLLPERAGALQEAARKRAHTRYLRSLGPRFLDRWASEQDQAELRAYLGEAYDEEKLRGHLLLVEGEEEQAPDEETFYRTSEGYLYDLTVFAMSGTKVPYREVLADLVPRGARLLDYGCGIGTDGLRLIGRGYDVEFAEYDNPSAEYLRWRLDQRGLDAAVHDLDGEVPDGFDLAYSFDVIEHVDDPFGFLHELERRAKIVLVNLLEPDDHEHDHQPHKPLPIPAILDHAKERGLLHYSVHYERSHLVAYRSAKRGGIDPLRGAVLRRFGPSLHHLAPLASASGLKTAWQRGRGAAGRVVRSSR